MNVEDYRKHPEKWLPVTWQSAPDRHFSSEIRIDVANRTGVLAAVAAAIASTETNIDHVSVESATANASMLIFEIRVRDRKHLARIVRIIRRMPDVMRVTRTIAAHAREHQARAHINLGQRRKDIPHEHTRARASSHAGRRRRPSAPIRRRSRWARRCTCPARFHSTRQTMQLVTGDIEAEIRRVFENLTAVAEAAGGSLANAVKAQRVSSPTWRTSPGERDHGELLHAALSGARHRRRRAAAARRARRNRVRILYLG